MEDTLAPGTFIDYRRSWGFVEEVEAVRDRIASLIKSGEAARAVALLEIFIAGCYEKSTEIDDSSGRFGQLVEGLFCDWIRGRQAATADPGDTVARLLSWMENDDYGYCHGLEREAVKVLDRAGLSAFERAVREKPAKGDRGSYTSRRKVEILKAIHEARKDVDAYASLCEGDTAPRDCEVLARLCLKRRMPNDALAWVERGIALEEDRWPNRSAWGLQNLKREILRKLGRGEDALASAWEEYRRAPSAYSYKDLMKFVPKSQRSEWHARALAEIDGAELSSGIALLVEMKERDRLARMIEAASREKLMGVSHYWTEPAARSLSKCYPLLAAKLHVAMALRVLEAKKSKYYPASIANLERARKILLQQGRAAEWEALASDIRENHRRKIGFLSAFERLAAGRPAREPSFLDRARKRWAKGAGRGRS